MKKVLIAEPHPYHFEVIPGVTYYFHRLGYDIELLVRDNYEHKDLFGNVPYADSIKVEKYRDIDEFVRILSGEYVKKFDFVFFNSLEYFHEIQKERVFDYIGIEKISSKYGVLGIFHNLEMVREDDIPLLKEKRIFALTECKYHEYVLQLLSASYFGKFDRNVILRKKRHIVLIGGSNDRKSMEKEIRKYPKKGLKNIKLSYIGRINQMKELASRTFGTFSAPFLGIFRKRIPNRGSIVGWFMYKKYGRLSFHDMFCVINNADFLFFIKDVKRMNAFLYGKTTGTKLLSVAFGKPLVSNVELTKAFGYPDDACIGYEKDIAEALDKINTMTDEEYQNMVENMKLFGKQLTEQSENNLKNSISWIIERGISKGWDDGEE